MFALPLPKSTMMVSETLIWIKKETSTADLLVLQTFAMKFCRISSRMLKVLRQVINLRNLSDKLSETTCAAEHWQRQPRGSPSINLSTKNALIKLPHCDPREPCTGDRWCYLSQWYKNTRHVYEDIKKDAGAEGVLDSVGQNQSISI